MDLDATKRTIAQAWDRGVADYDTLVGHGWLSRTEADAWKTALYAFLPPPPADILEVGAGTGVMSLLVAELGHRITAIDLSRGMLNEAHARALKHGLSVTFEIADAEALPFRDSSFDAVFGRHILWTLPDPPRALGEWRRVLRNSGRLVDSLALPRMAGVRLKLLAARLLAAVQPHRAGSHGYPEEIYAALPLRGVSDPRRYIELLKLAGFDVIKIEPLDELRRLEMRAMSAADRWRAQYRQYAFVGRRH